MRSDISNALTEEEADLFDDISKDQLRVIAKVMELHVKNYAQAVLNYDHSTQENEDKLLTLSCKYKGAKEFKGRVIASLGLEDGAPKVSGGRRKTSNAQKR